MKLMNKRSRCIPRLIIMSASDCKFIIISELACVGFMFVGFCHKIAAITYFPDFCFTILTTCYEGLTIIAEIKIVDYVVMLGVDCADLRKS